MHSNAEPHLSLWGRRELANRLWRPNLFMDDDAFLKPGSWVNDPWYGVYCNRIIYSISHVQIVAVGGTNIRNCALSIWPQRHGIAHVQDFATAICRLLSGLMFGVTILFGLPVSDETSPQI